MESSGKSIVIVDDEPDTAEMFSEMMRLMGFRPFKTVGGKGAIDLISSKMPSAILLDIMMPDLSGLDVLGELRRDPGLEDIPVIIVSAKSLPSDIQIALDLGASDYLTKPVTFIDLKRTIEKAIK